MHETQKNRPVTICIPTYNRPKEFARLIQQLLKPEITSFCNILVANNASTEKYDWSVLMEYKMVNLVHRQFNIGVNANILRLFEEVTTEWMMIIGDDDEIEPGFADILKIEMQNNTASVVAIKFSSNLFKENKRLAVNSINDCITQLEDPSRFGNTLLCSTWLIRRKPFVDHIRMSYVYASLHWPHFIPLLFILHKKQGCYIQSTEMPIKWNMPASESRWSYGHTYAAMLTTLPLLPIFENKEQIRKIARSIIINYDLRHGIRFGLWLQYCFPLNSDKIGEYICKLVGFKYKIGLAISPIIHRFASKKWILENFDIGTHDIDRL